MDSVTKTLNHEILDIELQGLLSSRNISKNNITARAAGGTAAETATVEVAVAAMYSY